MNIYGDPTPHITGTLDEKARQQIWQELTAKKYTQQILNNVLPPVPANPKAEMPYETAPGSGYQSHHAYPGGLVTHVATNVQITRTIIETYKTIYGYQVDYDVALAAQLLHDLHKPYVFQWDEEGSSRTEQTLAGTGEHHVLSAVELIARKAPPELVIAMISAHQCATTDEDEKILAGWKPQQSSRESIPWLMDLSPQSTGYRIPRVKRDSSAIWVTTITFFPSRRSRIYFL